MHHLQEIIFEKVSYVLIGYFIFMSLFAIIIGKYEDKRALGSGIRKVLGYYNYPGQRIIEFRVTKVSKDKINRIIEVKTIQLEFFEILLERNKIKEIQAIEQFSNENFTNFPILGKVNPQKYDDYVLYCPIGKI